jgi:hypothetical protein
MRGVPEHIRSDNGPELIAGTIRRIRSFVAISRSSGRCPEARSGSPCRRRS